MRAGRGRVFGYDFTVLGRLLRLIVRALFIYFVIIGLAVVLAPIVVQPKPSYYQTTCLSNMKQIGLSMMMYAQDYDERFPPASGFHKTEQGHILRTNWGMTYHVEENGKSVEIPGLIHPYVRNNELFRCPLVKPAKHWNPFLKAEPERETYMYNDLAAAEKLDVFTAPANTVLLAEGENLEGNAGHAWEKAMHQVPILLGRCAIKTLNTRLSFI
jgi:hypothetical protein